MKRFAKNTTVSCEKSQTEIKQIVRDFGGSAFGYAEEPDRAVIVFVCRERKLRFTLNFLQKDDPALILNGWGKVRTESQIRQAWDQDCRSRWRSLALSIKAKLSAIQEGIAEFDEEFLAQIVDPVSNETVYERVRGDITAAYLEQTSTPLRLTVVTG